MNEEFVNAYIETMNKKIEDLQKSEIMLQTRLKIAEKMLVSFQEDKQNLLVENEKLQASLNKKAPKVKENEF
jgi:hypothetical protein